MADQRRGARAGVLAAVALSLLAASTQLDTRPTVTLPPADGTFDYQLGGAYPPADDVQVVSRDRTEQPVPGVYSICYVNLLQTQPDEPGQSTTDPLYGTTAWWEQHHPDLLLRDADGELVLDDA